MVYTFPVNSESFTKLMAQIYTMGTNMVLMSAITVDT